MFESLNIHTAERQRNGCWIFRFHGCKCALDVSPFGTTREVWICVPHVGPSIVRSS